MRILIGIVIGIIIAEVGVVRIAQALQHVVDMIKSFV